MGFFKAGREAMRGMRDPQELQKAALSGLSAPGGFAHLTAYVRQSVQLAWMPQFQPGTP